MPYHFQSYRLMMGRQPRRVYRVHLHPRRVTVERSADRGTPTGKPVEMRANAVARDADVAAVRLGPPVMQKRRGLKMLKRQREEETAAVKRSNTRTSRCTRATCPPLQGHLLVP